ncbi:negative regulator of systemic acquired resistance (SNI1) [Trema orientale]|uniref:Negative regulator of systemic acquired resistance (SNI1) n=1 Tax=Trema orientale TaxID=63057 RepID=A0A2P5C8S8_TREOI|nr:negative regulator of systemic acquired resistance (SNI1) [Trema orientale]
MEVSGSRKSKRVGFEEENILAIINASGAKDTQDANDDRLAFLEAVRAVSIVSQNGTPPTHKMFQEVFKILRTGKALESIMASYQLLDELDKSFPRVYLADLQKSLSDSNVTPELVVLNEAWSPFDLTMEFSSYQREGGKDQGGPIDSYGFHLLIQDLVDVTDEMNIQKSNTMSLRNLLLFQYLVNILEGDFVPRNSAYEGTMNWTLLRESLLNMLLGSRKVNYKSLMKDCLTIMCQLYQISAEFSDDKIHPENSAEKSAENSDNAVTIALLEVGKNICFAMQKFLTMIMELDTSKKKADTEGYTTRTDGIRTPMVELILDELTYNKDIFHPFLQVFNEPRWKLEVVVQYFWKYMGKPSVRTRRSNGSVDDTTFSGALKCFSDITSTRSAIKKIGTEVIQLLLVHGFQAYLSLPSKHLDESTSAASGSSCSHIEICENIISAFRSLSATDKRMEITSFGKEALFTAATIISMKS